MNDKETLLEIPRNKLNFVSKEAEMLFDLTMEVDWLRQENQQLKDRINTYENPDDLTLMFMYCEEKAKDKIKELKEENKKYRHVIEEIEKICASVPEDWTICGVEKIYEIEQAIAEVNK